MDAEEYQQRWQTFLQDGFDDWLPTAYAISFKTGGKVTARQVVQTLVSNFYFPEGVQESEQDLVGKIESIFVHGLNAIIRDPKTGEVIGRARDNKKQAGTQKPAAPDPVRAKKEERRKRQQERNQARSQQNGNVDRVESGNADHP